MSRFFEPHHKCAACTAVAFQVKKLKIFQNKRGLMGCKWSSLNAPGTENPLSHPLLGLEEFHFPIIGPLG